MRKASSEQTMIQIMSNPKYKGKHIIVMKGEVFTAKTGGSANKLLDRLEKKYPKEIPVITYVPKADTLILWF
ncbi:MAG: DUF5678 domain-containing protein [Patescibacteria group bacterium]